MALLLRESDVRQLLTMPLALDLVERVHREYSTGKAIDVPRERTRLPKAALHILQGAVPSAGVFGYKAYTSSREGIRFLVYAFNAENGALDALVEANALGMMRTGAAGGVAAKWLAREDAKVAGVFGAGWQAQGQIEALAAVRDHTFTRSSRRTAASASICPWACQPAPKTPATFASSRASHFAATPPAAPVRIMPRVLASTIASRAPFSALKAWTRKRMPSRLEV